MWVNQNSPDGVDLHIGQTDGEYICGVRARTSPCVRLYRTACFRALSRTIRNALIIKTEKVGEYLCVCVWEQIGRQMFIIVLYHASNLVWRIYCFLIGLETPIWGNFDTLKCIILILDMILNESTFSLYHYIQVNILLVLQSLALFLFLHFCLSSMYNKWRLFRSLRLDWVP